MRHRKAYTMLSRKPKHKKALMRNLTTQLLKHERITTTVAKAKEVRPWIEKIFRYAKKENRHEANRKVHSVLFENDV